jgi:hypothetical protein
VSKHGEPRIWNDDNLRFEWSASVERDDLSIGKSDSEIPLPIAGDRNDAQLSRCVVKLASALGVLAKETIERAAQPIPVV